MAVPSGGTSKGAGSTPTAAERASSACVARAVSAPGEGAEAQTGEATARDCTADTWRGRDLNPDLTDSRDHIFPFFPLPPSLPPSHPSFFLPFPSFLLSTGYWQSPSVEVHVWGAPPGPPVLPNMASATFGSLVLLMSKRRHLHAV